MRSSKGSHRIVVQNVKYRWRATGNDGFISIGIWTSSNIGPFIGGLFEYQETHVNKDDGSFSAIGNQIVVTNRLIRRVIEHAITVRQYEPHMKGRELHLGILNSVINLDDAVRAVYDESRDRWHVLLPTTKKSP